MEGLWLAHCVGVLFGEQHFCAPGGVADRFGLD